MWTKFIVIIVLSILVIFAMPYAQHVIQWLVNAHDWISELLTDVFAGAKAGNLLRGFIALLIIPFIAGIIPTIFYWVIRRHWFPHFINIVWFVWLLQTGALLATYNVSA